MLNLSEWMEQWKGIMNVRLQLKCDGTRWRTGGELKGKLANGVGSQYSSHYLGTWCIQHCYRWCAHLGCQQSTELTPPTTGRFKWIGPFRPKNEIWLRSVCHHNSNVVYLSQHQRKGVINVSTDFCSKRRYRTSKQIKNLPIFFISTPLSHLFIQQVCEEPTDFFLPDALLKTHVVDNQQQSTRCLISLYAHRLRIPRLSWPLLLSRSPPIHRPLPDEYPH